MPLVLLLLTGAGGVATGVTLYSKGAEDPELSPKIMGVPAGPLATIGGLLMALFGGPMMGALGLSVAVGSLVAQDNLKRSKEGLDAAVATAVKAAMSQAQIPADAPAPLAIPQQPQGPLAQATAPGGLFSNLAKMFQPAAEA
jgi:hypothetical protein